jgi:hypothetical protein
VARFLGASILVALAYGVITIIAMLMGLFVDGASLIPLLIDSIQVLITLVVYSLPFIALMSLCSVVVGSAGLSALVGISVYVVVLIVVAVIRIKMPQVAEMVAYLIPNATKGLILQLQWPTLIQAILIVPIYVLAYGFLGWRIFSKRDI